MEIRTTTQASWESGTSRPTRRRKTTEEKEEDEAAWYQHYGDEYDSVFKTNKGNANNERTYTPFVVSTLNVHYLPNRGTPDMIALQNAMKGQDVQGLCEHNPTQSEL